MKKIRLLIIALLVIFGLDSYSQITYNSNNFAQNNDSFLVSKSSSIQLINFDFQQTGANHVWNFDSLEANTQSYKKYIDPDNSGYKMTWISNCMAQGGGLGCTSDWYNTTNLASINQDSLVIGGISLSDVSYFYKTNSNSLESSFYAYTIEIGGLPLKIVTNYSDIDTIYKFPLQYQNTDSAVMQSEMDLTSLGIDLINKKYQKRVNYVDGWGSLSTPYGNFPNVLRLKTLIYHNDTTISFGTTIPSNSTIDVIYSWFDTNYGIPVLQVEGKSTLLGETITSATYIDSLLCLNPNALFAYTPAIPIVDLSGNVDVNFTNLSSNSDIFEWQFGDGTNSTEVNPTHTYSVAGNYPVSLIAGNSVCPQIPFDTLILPIIIQDTNQIVANFTYNIQNNCLGDTTFFINSSSNSTSFEWDFGDGTYSTLENPYHIYNAIGNYEVQLIASDANQSDTIVKSISIITEEIDAGENIYMNTGDTAWLTATGTNVELYVWDFEQSLSCVVCCCPFAVPNVSTTYYVSSTNACGSDYDSVSVYMNPVSIQKTDSEGNISIYPNPSSGKFTIAAENIISIEIYDIAGKLQKQIPLSKLQSIVDFYIQNKGIYFAKIRTLDNTITKMLICR